MKKCYILYIIILLIIGCSDKDNPINTSSNPPVPPTPIDTNLLISKDYVDSAYGYERWISNLHDLKLISNKSYKIEFHIKSTSNAGFFAVANRDGSHYFYAYFNQNPVDTTITQFFYNTITDSIFKAEVSNSESNTYTVIRKLKIWKI